MSNLIGAEQVRQLIIEELDKLLDGQSWAKFVGPIVPLSAIDHPRGNWDVIARGSSAQTSAVRKVAELIQIRHPFIRWSG